MSDSGVSDRSAAAAPCPICRRPAEKGYRPFCSRRCADVDLARWFNGVYRIGNDETEAEAQDRE